MVCSRQAKAAPKGSQLPALRQGHQQRVTEASALAPGSRPGSAGPSAGAGAHCHLPRAARSQKETQPCPPPQQPEGLWLARLVGPTGGGGIHDQPADDRRPTPHHSALLIGGILGGLHTLKGSQMQT